MIRRRAACLAAALLGGGLAGCAEDAGVQIPEPDLASAEDAVRQAVQEARQAVEAAPGSAQAWGQLGDRYRAEAWRGEAATCYRQAELLEPSQFLWPYRLGKTLRTDDPERAAEALARAIALDDGYAPAHLQRALTLVVLGRFDEARRHFELAHRLDPNSAPALLGLGQLALSAGRIDEARESLSRSLALDPTDGRTHLALAQAAQLTGDRELAERHAREARRLLQNLPVDDPRDLPETESVSVAEVTKLGRRLLGEGKPEQALPHLQAAIRRDPESEVPRLTLGLALVLLGRPDEAETQLRQAVSLEPLRPASRAALGKFLLFTRDLPGEAEAELREAVRLDPDDSDARLHLGLAQARSGRLAEAETTFRGTVEREPGSNAARYRLAVVLAARGRNDEAERELRETIRRIDAASAEGRPVGTMGQARALLADSESSLGYLLLETGRVTESVERFRRAVEQRPDHAPAQLGLGRALARAGERAAARAAYERALQLRPGWPDALRALTELQER